MTERDRPLVACQALRDRLVMAAQQFHCESECGDGDQPFAADRGVTGNRRQAGPRDADAVDDGEGRRADPAMIPA